MSVKGAPGVFIMYCRNKICTHDVPKSIYLSFNGIEKKYSTNCGLVTIWHHRNGSTLVQVMESCLTAPGHYRDQCWFLISAVLWQSHESIFVLKLMQNNRHFADGNSKFIYCHEHVAEARHNTIYTITIHTQVSLQQVESDSTIHINASNKLIAWIPDGTSCSISTLDYDYMWRKWRWITMTFNRNILKGHCEIQISHDIAQSPFCMAILNGLKQLALQLHLPAQIATNHLHRCLHKKLLSKHSTAFLSTRIILSSLLFNRLMHTVISVNSLWPGPLY